MGNCVLLCSFYTPSLTLTHHTHHTPPSLLNMDVADEKIRILSLDNLSYVGGIFSSQNSRVYCAVHVKKNIRVAVKYAVKEKQENSIVEEAIILEALEKYKSLEEEKGMHFPVNIVSFAGLFKRNSHFFLATVYYPNGCLFDYVLPESDDHVDYDEVMAMKWIKQLASAIAFVHRCGYVHADIKPDNCFMDQNHDLYLGDFGLSVMDKTRLKIKSYGTYGYTCPELLSSGSEPEELTVRTSADVWSYGIVVYIILLKDIPWNTAENSDPGFSKYKQDLAIPFRDHRYKEKVPELAMSLMKRCLDPNPDTRIRMEDAIYLAESYSKKKLDF